jgi:DNA-binding response OmpR family regulator
MPKTRILLVEDEEGIRELLFELLVDAGFEIVQADTGDMAFRLLEHDNLQLLLTDINMPGRLDGVELAKLARLSHPDIPIVFMTGRPDGAARAQHIQQPRAVLEKPFDLTHVLKTVRRLASAT